MNIDYKLKYLKYKKKYLNLKKSKGGNFINNHIEKSVKKKTEERIKKINYNFTIIEKEIEIEKDKHIGNYKLNYFIESSSSGDLIIEEKNLYDLVKLNNNSDEYIIIFSGEWCEPCKLDYTILDLSSQHDSLKFLYIDVDGGNNGLKRDLRNINKTYFNGDVKMVNMINLIFTKLYLNINNNETLYDFNNPALNLSAVIMSKVKNLVDENIITNSKESKFGLPLYLFVKKNKIKLAYVGSIKDTLENKEKINKILEKADFNYKRTQQIQNIIEKSL